MDRASRWPARMAFLKDHPCRKPHRRVSRSRGICRDGAGGRHPDCSREDRSSIEDFEIRKALILPDPPSGVRLRADLRTRLSARFPFQSRFEQAHHGRCMSLAPCAASGRNRHFAASAWDWTVGRGPGVQVAVDALPFSYGHMSDHGTQIRRGVPDAIARIVSRAAANRRVQGFVVRSHRKSTPGSINCTRFMLDGALQIFIGQRRAATRRRMQGANENASRALRQNSAVSAFAPGPSPVTFAPACRISTRT